MGGQWIPCKYSIYNILVDWSREHIFVQEEGVKKGLTKKRKGKHNAQNMSC